LQRNPSVKLEAFLRQKGNAQVATTKKNDENENKLQQ
jgi:hypothetical protein